MTKQTPPRTISEVEFLGRLGTAIATGMPHDELQSYVDHRMAFLKFQAFERAAEAERRMDDVKGQTADTKRTRSAMKIYLAAIPLYSGSGAVTGSTKGGDVLGVALAEDGTGLATHLCSSVSYARSDMGLTSGCKHNIYSAHAPDGFTLEWVDDVETHEGYRAALALNQKTEERCSGKVGGDQ